MATLASWGWTEWWLFGALAGLAVLGFIGSQWAMRRRREALAKVAAGLGLEFDPMGAAVPRDLLNGLELFGSKSWRQFRNVMHGPLDNGRILLCDYEYSEHAGKHGARGSSQSTRRISVVLIVLPGERFPTMALRPETVWRKIGHLVGMQDIDFETHPEFSKRYAVRGPDEGAIRAFLTPATLDLLEQHAGWCLEASGRVLAVYQEGERRPPARMGALMEQALELLYGLEVAAKR